VLNRWLPGIGLVAVSKRVAADQLLFAPPFVGLFLAVVALLENRLEEIPALLADEWGPTVIKNWELWVPAQYLNFALMPAAYQAWCRACWGGGVGRSPLPALHGHALRCPRASCMPCFPSPLQVLFANGVGLCWTIYLSVVSHHHHPRLEQSVDAPLPLGQTTPEPPPARAP
jgi:hypothetical protein